MRRISKLWERRVDLARHAQLLEQLNKANERWWVGVLRAMCIAFMLLPLKTEWFSTAKLCISIAGAIGLCLTKVLTHLHRAPLSRWRHLATGAAVIGTLWIIMPAYLLLCEEQGNRESMFGLLCCAPFAWLLFGYCRLRIRRIRRESAAAIERIRREQRRRRRLELL